MGVREQINDNKKLGIGITSGLLVLAMGLMAARLLSGRENGAAPPPKSVFYTDDNGKGFFKDDVNRIAPFDHNGKQAYRADVFRGGDGTQFVGLIYRFTDPGRREMQAYVAKKPFDPDGSARMSIEQRGMQVKRPGGGEKEWADADDAIVQHLQASIKDPAGRPAKLVEP